MIEDFKKELKALLEKYDAVLTLEFDSCDIAYKMSGERMGVFFRKEKEYADLAKGYNLDASDL